MSVHNEILNRHPGNTAIKSGRVIEGDNDAVGLNEAG